MFENQFFDQWLQQKSSEILGKVEKEKNSTEDIRYADPFTEGADQSLPSYGYGAS